MSTHAPLSPLPVKVVLDIERTIQYDRFAEFHMGTLPRPSSLRDLAINEGRTYSALVQWVWACLSPRDRMAFSEPAKLVPHITEKNTSEVASALLKTWAAVQEPEEGSPNDKGSTIGPSPASGSTSQPTSSTS